MQSSKNQSDRQGHLPFISKFAYGMGDVGCNFSWMFVGNFLMIFYTDVCGIGMAAVSMLVLVARIWDAVKDPVVGSLADRTRSRWGRYRPWLLFGAPLTAVVLVLTFWAHPSWPGAAQSVYMYATYCLLVLGYACVNIPYGTLCGALTQNIGERAQVNTARSVCAMIAINVINIITLPLIGAFGGSDAARGYLLVAVLYGAIFTLCSWLSFAKTKEVVQAPPRQKLSLKLQLAAAWQNKPYLVALAGQFLFGITLYGRSADLLYYFKYVEGNEALFTVYSTILIAPSILGAAAFPFVFEKLGNKGHAAALFAAGTGVSLVALYFFSAVSAPVPFYLLSALSQFFYCAFNTAIYAVVPDCVEYGEWKTGVRNDGFQYSVVSLCNKLGMAVGTAALAGALGAFGFVPNQAQNATVQAVMGGAFSLVPGVLWLVTAAVLLLYRINRQSYAQIMADLEARKAQG